MSIGHLRDMKAGVVQFAVAGKPGLVGQLQVAEFTSIIVILVLVVAMLIVITILLYRKRERRRKLFNANIHLNKINFSC